MANDDVTTMGLGRRVWTAIITNYAGVETVSMEIVLCKDVSCLPMLPWVCLHTLDQTWPWTSRIKTTQRREICIICLNKYPPVGTTSQKTTLPYSKTSQFSPRPPPACLVDPVHPETRKPNSMPSRDHPSLRVTKKKKKGLHTKQKNRSDRMTTTIDIDCGMDGCMDRLRIRRRVVGSGSHSLRPSNLCGKESMVLVQAHVTK
ncbi:hypothetical protein FN846DRAFT_84790 [Sphaerosporella brunnea]|uniref:Uncharacterized protein n=1 Tax=Sphaerosporella brunnea TaxID=1250544 RepID=A0A5J5ESM0_9PEZI|nr:hypothetical protein FN846DRAFT_84790 [Sphaerosporella brunnea]